MPQGPIATNVALNPDRAAAPMQLDAQGALIQAPRHGKYFQSAISQKLFGAANPAGVTLSAALATTYVGLCLSNPAASGVNLALKRVAGILIVAPAAYTGLGLITGYAAGGVTAHTTPITTAANQFLNGAAPLAKVDAACTIVGTPRWNRWLAVSIAATGIANFAQDLDDAIVIPPGGYCAIGGNIAGPASGFLGSIEWEELPI